jgi:hypothetical protein
VPYIKIKAKWIYNIDLISETRNYYKRRGEIPHEDVLNSDF